MEEHTLKNSNELKQCPANAAALSPPFPGGEAASPEAGLVTAGSPSQLGTGEEPLCREQEKRNNPFRVSKEGLFFL